MKINVQRNPIKKRILNLIFIFYKSKSHLIKNKIKIINFFEIWFVTGNSVFSKIFTMQNWLHCQTSIYNPQ